MQQRVREIWREEVGVRGMSSMQFWRNNLKLLKICLDYCSGCKCLVCVGLHTTVESRHVGVQPQDVEAWMKRS